MIGMDILNIKIFGSDTGWKTVFEKSYNHTLFNNEDEQEAYRNQSENELIEFINTNEFLQSQDENDREFFKFLVVWISPTGTPLYPAL